MGEDKSAIKSGSPMLGVLGPLSSQTKLFSSRTKPRGDSFIFRMHYRTTFVFIMACCLLVTATQYLGDKIACLVDKDSLSQKVIDTYCFISSTYTLPSTKDMQEGLQVAHRGLGPDVPEEETVYHNYYMWVPYVLFLQALCFYVPHWLWKMMQTDKVMNVLQGLNYLIVDQEQRKKKEDTMVEYLYYNWGRHNIWAIKYVVCETLNLLNIILQLIITNQFLGGEFMTYGTQVVEFMNYEPQNRSDPMYEIFPRITKCSFHRYGPSGSIERHDALCVLSINILNEKIYLALWFWFLFLLVLTILLMLYRVATLLFKPVRSKLMLGRNARYGSRDTAYFVAEKCDFGDWYLLNTLSRNMNGPVFAEVLKKLTRKMEGGDDATLKA
ncbi:innexin inx2-like isoform X1 [Amphibalanus amphitrite]|uniref:innexin inx2-like isoform X1 n=2 Tax=Amphibalanus amphitrite TaxID=1232801 RepID=UPI001C922863|nr:innexin inx2-like isoform X1 [Amphibalanus amphitrite]